ncbi:hypothetical protein A3Q29_12075 [Providencia stuartii]|uniref:Minor fimbrial subunit StfF n=1 Tax=Providencia stuartii TaxID=588 RepID=A0A1S1HTZ3_PROST|nr:hypothetical protein A3Q29_12075 [Providencia stuartii]
MNKKRKRFSLGVLLTLCGLVVTSAQAANTVQINIKGNLILNPPCDISGPGNGPIDVDFSDMVIRKITGNNYQQPVNYTLTCDAPDTTNVALTFVGDGVQLNSVNALKPTMTIWGSDLRRWPVATPRLLR